MYFPRPCDFFQVLNPVKNCTLFIYVLCNYFRLCCVLQVSQNILDNFLEKEKHEYKNCSEVIYKFSGMLVLRYYITLNKYIIYIEPQWDHVPACLGQKYLYSEREKNCIQVNLFTSRLISYFAIEIIYTLSYMIKFNTTQLHLEIIWSRTRPGLST